MCVSVRDKGGINAVTPVPALGWNVRSTSERDAVSWLSESKRERELDREHIAARQLLQCSGSSFRDNGLPHS